MPGRLCQLWDQEEFRRSFVAALRGWNSALDAGWPERLRAAGLLKQIFDRYDSSSPANRRSAEARDGSEHAAEHGAAHPLSPETPSQTLDRLLDFPSRRLAVYGSLAPGKKNHHVIAGINGSWRKAVLHGSLRNEGWGAGEGFPGFLWDGTNMAVAAQVFSSADLPHYWTMLDEFEGEEYRRILAPADIAGGEMEICNVYALAKS
ncbi:MAG TPA: gamma-glutamylcyclotransferase family protein [Candidatus Angelobacter sp.]|jgi:gamma-glutamylcyclotransferase (GGCT)/AIG2-like uncharacterized protein YtfP